MPPDITRVVALGASNLTRGLQSVVSIARDEWGHDVEVVGALGLGRSYGTPSRLWGRRLPGILQCGLWQALDLMPPAPTRALITDVGNDILFGASADDIVGWVSACVGRLRPFTRDIVLTDLPLENVPGLGAAKFALVRTIFFPGCRLSLAQVVDIAKRVVEGLEQLAVDRGVRFVRLRREWYGLDPIHIRSRCWRAAWREIVCGQSYVGPAELRSAASTPTTIRLRQGSGETSPKLEERRRVRSALRIAEALRLYTMRPEREWILGVEHVTPQRGVRLGRGSRVWLY